MLRVVEVRELVEALGCNDGAYGTVAVVLRSARTGTEYIVECATCRCGNGCSNTDKIPQVGYEFSSMQEYHAYLRQEYIQEDAVVCISDCRCEPSIGTVMERIGVVGTQATQWDVTVDAVWQDTVNTLNVITQMCRANAQEDTMVMVRIGGTV